MFLITILGFYIATLITIIIYVNKHINTDRQNVITALHYRIYEQTFLDVYGKHMSANDIKLQERKINNVNRWLNLHVYYRILLNPMPPCV